MKKGHTKVTFKALRENVNFMWISGNNRPDFRAINRFGAA